MWGGAEATGAGRERAVGVGWGVSLQTRDELAAWLVCRDLCRGCRAEGPLSS